MCVCARADDGTRNDATVNPRARTHSQPIERPEEPRHICSLNFDLKIACAARMYGYFSMLICPRHRFSLRFVFLRRPAVIMSRLLFIH